MERAVFTQRFQITRQAKSVDNEADAAVKDGDFAKAETLYREHLVVFPDDIDTKIKYADVLLKVDSSPKRQDQALQIYAGILTGNIGRADVRQKRMELNFANGYFRNAEADLKILLNMDENENNGHFMYLLARCYESGEKYADAVKAYLTAIEHTEKNTTDQIEAYKHLATLLRRPAQASLKMLISHRSDGSIRPQELPPHTWRAAVIAANFTCPKVKPTFRRRWSWLIALLTFTWRWPRPRSLSRGMTRRDKSLRPA